MDRMDIALLLKKLNQGDASLFQSFSQKLCEIMEKNETVGAQKEFSEAL